MNEGRPKSKPTFESALTEDRERLKKMALEIIAKMGAISVDIQRCKEQLSHLTSRQSEISTALEHSRGLIEELRIAFDGLESGGECASFEALREEERFFLSLQDELRQTKDAIDQAEDAMRSHKADRAALKEHHDLIRAAVAFILQKEEKLKEMLTNFPHHLSTRH